MYLNGIRSSYTPTPAVVRLVSEVLDYFEADPNRWDQSGYGSADSSTNCFMGGVIRLSGADPKTDSYDNLGYCLWPAMQILGLDYDRAAHIAYWADDDRNEKPTVDELRERVSEALNYNFRKPKVFNDPTVDCCKRDAADCDC